MAGGNLSPRQKMINMMYLVLTALLALNVSAEILDAFSSLRASLAESARSFADKNTDTKEGILAKIDDEISTGNTKNANLKDIVTDVEKRTNGLITSINGHIEQLEEIGEKEEDGEIKNKKETEGNYQYWMGPGGDDANNGRGAGAAIKLRGDLNDYVSWANGYVKEKELVTEKSDFKDFRQIAEDPEDETWEYHTFHGKPVIADLAMLEKFKLDVQEIHSEILNLIKARLGAVTFKIDSLILVDAPISRVVAAGMKFETKLYVSATSKEAVPEFSGSGSIQTTDGGYAAIMTINAQGGFAKGANEKKATYSAKAKIPDAYGNTKELTLNGEFTIRKPEVVITSASVQNLYFQCGNTINVDVPALGDLYNPKFSVSKGKALPSSSDKKKVTIVPTGRTCVLGVSSVTNGQTIKIDDVKYNVIKPPKPTIELLVNGKPSNGAQPISKKSRVIVRLKADSDFKAALPRDARYAINKIELKVARSLGAPTNAGSYSGSGKDATKGIPITLGNKLKSDGPGTKIYFKIDKVYRINFQNKKVAENFGERDLYIGAVIK